MPLEHAQNKMLNYCKYRSANARNAAWTNSSTCIDRLNVMGSRLLGICNANIANGTPMHEALTAALHKPLHHPVYGQLVWYEMDGPRYTSLQLRMHPQDFLEGIGAPGATPPAPTLDIFAPPVLLHEQFMLGSLTVRNLCIPLPLLRLHFAVSDVNHPPIATTM